MTQPNIDMLVEEARTKRTPPAPTKEKGQRSLDFNAPFFFRYMPQWNQPDYMGAQQWRKFVQDQNVAVDCRDAIINNTLALDWKISPRDSTRMDELKPLIDYYTNFLTYTGEYEFADIIEWLLKDYLDLPFGGAAEIGREGDQPNGQALWIQLLDGGTCFPTRSTQYPVGQAIPTDVQHPVFFPSHAINRIYMSPRTEFIRAGWGMAPPEKIYFSMKLLSQGDTYYSHLLLDTPEAGILDLINMSKESAENWIEAFRAYMQGVDPFKIPVLYEHEREAKWIPFGRPPTELLFDRVTTKYAAIVCSGYGLTLSDIGFASSTSGGDTLAGSIRQERKSKRQGFAKAKKRLEAWFNRVIDPTQSLIRFEWIDLDDEFAIAQGRARLATATAIQQMIDSGLVSPDEGRQQVIADRIFTISMPEKRPEDAKMASERMQENINNSPERPGMLGKPVSPSQGGHGEVLPRSDFEKQLSELSSVSDIRLKRLAYAALPIIKVSVKSALDELELSEMGLWANYQHNVIWGDDEDAPELMNTVLSSSRSALDKAMKDDRWWEVFSETEKIIDDLSNMIWDAEAERQYILGLCAEVEDFTVESKRDMALRKSLKQELTKINLGMKPKVQNAVLSGITQYAAKRGEQLDETLKIDDNLLREIRSQLMFLQENVLTDFGKNLQKIMEKK